jgi:hypothetical protein
MLQYASIDIAQLPTVCKGWGVADDATRAERIRERVRTGLEGGQFSIADLIRLTGLSDEAIRRFTQKDSSRVPYPKTLARYETALQQLAPDGTPVRGGTGTPADSATSAGPSGAPPGAFADGVLHAAYRMSLTLSELIAEAMQGRGMARPAGPPPKGKGKGQGPWRPFQVVAPETPPGATTAAEDEAPSPN